MTRKNFALRDLAPPGLIRRGGYLLRRLRGDGTVFAGNYASWPDAAKAASGYADPAILEHTRRATALARDNPALFERDAVILPRPDYPLHALAALLHVANQQSGRLRVLDFGGALGSTFFQLRPFLAPLREVRWTVIEQPHYVECGRREFADERLRFHADVAAALSEGESDVLLLSSVLQYLPAPHAMLKELLSHRPAFVLLDRTALHVGTTDRLTVQHNPPSIYPASYPAWFLNEQRLVAHFDAGYRLVFSFAASDYALHLGPASVYRGYFYAALPAA
ncbi:methyltransferase, TIGR04325 family [Oleiharenicola sp. Vm1]|uniref:methyltransferase, TIGR04325 family n=1 Tax=Oleiharenicola sp. Vm1 TaxID=3398393 RepID=UPI0039F58929